MTAKPLRTHSLVSSPHLAILEQENLWGYRKRLRFILDSIAGHYPGRAPASLSILDVGCGNGTVLALPLAYLGYRVTGLDVDAASVVRARELTGSLSARFLCGDLQALAPPSGSMSSSVRRFLNT